MYNVGSVLVNFINLGTCVTGGALVSYYPSLYGTECYWRSDKPFAGWNRYRQPTDASPYYSVLIAQFECFASNAGVCFDWGYRMGSGIP